MTIVKTVEFRNRLKELLELTMNETEEVYLDYYNQLFQLVPVHKKQAKSTQTSKIIQKYKNRKARSKYSKSRILNESDPSLEKENFRNLKYLGNV